MALFSSLYNSVLALAGKPQAERYLAVLSFAESSFFPIPPDVMLLPMSVTQPSRWLRYGLITTIASVLGGIFGYALGFLTIESLMPLIEQWGYAERFELANAWFAQYGFWVVLVAGFSPIPYKLFTVAAGAAGIALIPFILASIIGRGARFFLVSLAGAKLGPKAEPWIRRHVEPLGWATAIALVAVIAWKMSS